jgi:hypothetical protein
MKAGFKKNQSEKATKNSSARGLALEDQRRDNSVDNHLYQRVGKSRQEIVDFMKILKTF